MLWLGTGALLVTAAAVCWWLRRRLLVVTVQGPSMEPAYRHGDRVLVRRRSGDLVAAGEVVVADLPPEPSRVVKRVAAVAGDRTPTTAADRSAPVVPAGHLVLLGDNTSASYDSRHYGHVPADAVIGVVLRHLR